MNLLLTYNSSLSLFWGVNVVCDARIGNKWWTGNWCDSLLKEAKPKIKRI
ncbi:hypothetical protein F383_06200 [Gossypium arboreum]|uniref:Uncharacterized protein n=1 Tax=Gossypium arboreum TaxID=29729 RepID=A0A0B0PEM9_GOSAR|nr:hypothetical protein F383_06200 [Gossypium arboreum]